MLRFILAPWAACRWRAGLNLENPARRQQLAVQQRAQKCPGLRAAGRAFIRRISGDHRREWAQTQPPPPETGQRSAPPVLGGLIHDDPPAA